MYFSIIKSFVLKIVYHLITTFFQWVLPILGFTSKKMQLFAQGRKKVWKQLQTQDFKNNDWFWFHCASLGEYEQAVPLIQKIKDTSSKKILVSFFSPSGYEQKKKHHLIDFACYLPIDTHKNAQKFVQIIQPQKAFFVKYEFWENYFVQLQKYQIPIYMVSAAFRENQIFFKWYGSFFKNTLKRVTHFFVQNSLSLEILKKQDFKNVSVSGDTRFDRVYAQLQMDNHLDFMEEFIQNRLCVVLGSTWPECENAFAEVINQSPKEVCFVIAPHEIKTEKINSLKSKITTSVSIFNEGVDCNSQVLIVDTVGYLSRIYSYADIAYVGGAMGTTGLHNILEPATFGMPIIIGPNHYKFPEAQNLKNYGGLSEVENAIQFQEVFCKLIENKEYRDQMSSASAQFVKSQIGATQIIVNHL